MDANQKSWALGGGCGCLTFLVSIPLVGGLVVLAAWLAWEYGGVHHDLVSGPAAVTYGPIIGIVFGVVAGLIVTVVVRSIVKKRQRPPTAG